MPNTRAVRSYKTSGMSKTIGTDSGGVPSQGLPEDFNTTYPNGKTPNDNVVPVNDEYKARIPTTIEPLGDVNLSPVSLGGK